MSDCAVCKKKYKYLVKTYTFKEFPDEIFCDCNVYIAIKTIELSNARKLAEENNNIKQKNKIVDIGIFY